MLRSHDYPRHAARFRRELQDELDAMSGNERPPVLMPGRMTYDRFKDDGSGSPPRRYGESGRSAVEALERAAAQTQVLYSAAGVPVAVVTPSEVSDGMGATQLPRNFDQEIYEEPLPRNVLPRGRMQLTDPQLARMAAEEHARVLRSRVAVETKLSRALAQSSATAAAMDQLLADDEQLPWWLRGRP
jgi:hypothetical protein